MNCKDSLLTWLWLGLAAGLPLGASCADPNPSTLNQKCFHDEDCDEGQFCERTEGAPDGLCRMGAAMGTDTGAEDTSGNDSAMEEDTGGPMTGNDVDDDPTMPTDDGVEDTGDVDTSATDGTDAESDGTDATTGPGIACSDGTPVQGEVCFADPLVLASLTNARGIDSDDIDGDGHADLAVAYYGNGANGGVQRFLGEGDGTFGLGQEIDLGNGGFERIALGAIADNDVDVCACNPFDSRVRCASGNGDGTFAAQIETVGCDFDVLLFLVNDDNVLDLMRSSGDEFLAGVVGDSQETFDNETFLDEDWQSFPILGMTHADMNGDDAQDIITTHPSVSQVRVQLFDPIGENGVGAFDPWADYTSLTTVAAPADVAVGDFDGDGDADVAAAVEERVSIFLGGGTGLSFGAEIVLMDVDPGTVGIGVADFNLDGLDDVVTANTSGSLSVLISEDGDNWEDPVTITIAASPYDLTIGDFNEDTVPDIGVAAGTNVQVVLSDP